MKRSMLLVLAGFGLASMLFALVAFVGEEKNAENDNLLYVRIVEAFTPDLKSVITIAYPDGKVEHIEMQDGSYNYKRKEFNINITIIASTLNKINSQGYSLKTHAFAWAGNSYHENFVFEKK